MTYLRVQLKVCEGCGALWLRSQDIVDIYCTSCQQRLRGFPRVAKRRLGRPCKNNTRAASNDGGRQ